MAIVEFKRKSLDVVTSLLHNSLIFSNSSALDLVLASTKMEPSARRIHVNSSFNFLCKSVHIFIPFSFEALFSSSKLRTWNLVHVSLLVPTRWVIWGIDKALDGPFVILFFLYFYFYYW